MKRAILLTSILLALWALPTALQAFTMNQKVVVMSQLIAVARTGAGGISADERIDQINGRLTTLLPYDGAVRSIHLGQVNGETAILVGNNILMTVTSRDAAANGVSVRQLGRQWLRNARLALPGRL